MLWQSGLHQACAAWKCVLRREGLLTSVGRPDLQSHFAKLVNELERGMASLLETYRTGALLTHQRLRFL